MNSKLLTKLNTLPKFTVFKFLLLLLAISSVNKMQAQEWNAYTAEQLQITPTFAALPSTKTVIHGGTWNDAVTNVSIGFTFQFNGVNYTSTNVSTNGFITFGATAPASNLYTPISSNTGYAGAVSAFGRDLLVNTVVTGTPQPNSVSYLLDTSGGAGNYILKIEWFAAKRLATDSGNVSFQIWLKEGSNVIEIHYGIQTTAFSVNIFPEVGLRGPSNSEYYNFSWATALNNWPTLPTVMTTAGNANTATAGLRSGAARIVSGSNRLFRFTPVNCFPPSLVTVSNIAINTADVTWNAPSIAPSNGYQYYLSTSATAPTAGTTPTGTAATNSMTLSGLAGGTTYYLWVRSDCGGSTSGWSAVSTFSTLCTAVNVPYYLGFDPFSDGFSVPALPACTSIQNVGTGNNWVTENAFDAFVDEHLVYNFNSNAANVWFFTHGINMTAGTTYKLLYVYGGSTNLSTLTNRMEVSYGMSPSAAGMTTQLAIHPQIKTSAEQGIVNFTPTASGVYYFGFKAYSLPNMGKLFLDDIQVVDGGCKPPTALSAANITGSTATISWTAPNPAPGSGYAYYLTNTNTPPAYQATPTASVPAGSTVANLTGLSGNTTYYIWVHSVCGTGDYSQWSQVLTFTTLPQPVYTYCTPAPTSVDYQGIINVTFSTVNNSTGAEPGNYANYSNLIGNVAQGTTIPVAITYNTGPFSYNTRIWIDWNNDSDFSDAGETVYTGLSGSTSPNTLNASFTVPMTASLGEHRMRIGGADINDLSGFGAGQGPCYNGSWGSFEDYTVNVTVPPPALTISSTSFVACAGTPTPLITITSNLASYDNYQWSPAAPVSGDAASGYTITATSSQIFTLTASQNSFPFSTNSVSFTYSANPLPTPIVISPSAPVSCQEGPAIALTATGGVVSNLPIYFENFNGGATGWAFTNNSVGGNVAGAAWQNVNSPHNPGWATISSNDASGFYFSDSDDQGSGTTTNVTMASPPVDLSGYNNATVRFFHYLNQWTNGGGYVEVSTNSTNGIDGTWTTLQSYLYSGGDIGTASNFAQATIDLSGYLTTNVRIRFRYQVQWGWGWAIDNFSISGSATSAITWAPTTGLYEDAAATIPYTGTGTNVVYAMPSAATTYTASASTPSPTICTTTTTTNVTVTPIAGGAVTPASQSGCDTVGNLTLAGHSGSILRWEWSTSPTFATIGGTIANTTSTLTVAQMGTFAGTRYFRAVLSNSGCTAYSYAPTAPTYASVTYNTVTWNGSSWSPSAPTASTAVVFAGNYTGNANLSACSVLVSSGNVVFNSGYTLTVTNGVTVTGGTLTFNNNASLVQINDAAVNSGYIRYYRTTTPMVRYDYTYWSSPLSPQTLLGVSPLTMSDKYFTFNTTANTYVNVASNSLMTPGKGYIIRAPEGHPTTPTTYTAEFDGGHLTPPDGVPNNGVYTQPVYGPGPNNFNLLGNPYPSAIDADLFYSANMGVMDGSFYFWTHNTPINPLQYTQSDYAIYNSTGGTGTGTAGGGTGNTSVPNGNIAAGQGFFIKGTANGTVTFNNSMRLVGLNNQFFRMPGIAAKQVIEKHRVWLDIRNSQGAYKQTLVGYVAGATNEKENAFDADAADTGTLVNLYSLVGAEKTAIQGRALPFDPSDEVPLGYKSTTAGQLEITLHNFDGLFSAQNIYLEDKLLNVIHDLKAGSYIFVTEAGTFDNRFVLRYTDTALSISDQQLHPDAVVVYKNAEGIQIMASNLIMKEVRIFDVRGRLLLTRDSINASQTTISNLQAQEQVLIVQITTHDNKKVNKKIVY